MCVCILSMHIYYMHVIAPSHACVYMYINKCIVGVTNMHLSNAVNPSLFFLTEKDLHQQGSTYISEPNHTIA